MSRRIRRLVIVGAVLASCATWPNVRCTEESPPIAVVLDAIQRLAEIHKADQKAQIVEALFVCRDNAHSGSAPGGALTQEKHCEFVVAAYRWAVKKDFAKCLTQLMHGSGQGMPIGPSGPPMGRWPDMPCGILTARDMLDFVRAVVEADLPTGDPLRDQIVQDIDDCLSHPPSGAVLSLAQHCAKVRAAFTEATKIYPDWVYVSKELDHMP